MQLAIVCYRTQQMTSISGRESISAPEKVVLVILCKLKYSF